MADHRVFQRKEDSLVTGEIEAEKRDLGKNTKKKAAKKKGKKASRKKARKKH
jgi:hypothetical protein